MMRFDNQNEIWHESDQIKVGFDTGSGLIIETLYHLSDTSGIWEEPVKLFQGDCGIWIKHHKGGSSICVRFKIHRGVYHVLTFSFFLPIYIFPSWAWAIFERKFFLQKSGTGMNIQQNSSRCLLFVLDFLVFLKKFLSQVFFLKIFTTWNF